MVEVLLEEIGTNRSQVESEEFPESSALLLGEIFRLFGESRAESSGRLEQSPR
jgi:hypothetical protein